MRSLKVASLKIEVDHPFHTPWMNPARKLLNQALEREPLKCRPPKIAFLSSVSGEIFDSANFSPQKLMATLVAQSVTPVNFPKQIASLSSLGVNHFVEIGPSEMLSPFVEQILERRGRAHRTASYLKPVADL
jgi:[acyl-carrier-protein] S-malonyltransferase